MSPRIQITREEQQLLDALFASQPELPERCRVDLANVLSELRQIIPAVQNAVGYHSDVHQGEIAVIGLANHAYNLLLAGIGNVAGGNPHAWSACVRGLYEGYGAAVFLTESPDRATALLDRGIRAGKLRAAAVRSRPEFARDFDRLNSIVHPGPRSLVAGFTMTDAENQFADWSMGPQVLPLDLAEHGVSVLVNLGRLIAESVTELVQVSGALRAGRRVLERPSRPPGGEVPPSRT